MTVDPKARTRLLDALERHARHEMKWGSDVVKQIEPTSVRHLRVWSAELDTLREQRFLRRVNRVVERLAVECAPTMTGDIDPWSLVVDGPLDFKDDTTEVDIAGTEHVKTCSMCHGDNKVRCPECGGEGAVGYRRTCMTCRGSGLAECGACEGQGRLMELRVVEVVRRHLSQRHIDRETPVPAEALAKATRDELLHLDIPRVNTATYDATTAAYRGRGPSADPVFEDAVRKMISDVEGSEEGGAAEQIVRQRLVVRHVPVDEVQYDWRGDPGTFWLVGTEEQVYGEDMPLKGAFVSRAVSAAKQRFGGLVSKGLFGRLSK